VRDSVADDLPRGRLGSFNGVLLRIPVKENVQFRNFGNPTAIDFPVELNRELHSHSLPPIQSRQAALPHCPRTAQLFANAHERFPAIFIGPMPNAGRLPERRILAGRTQLAPPNRP
jgi:hypothetical protein